MKNKAKKYFVKDAAIDSIDKDVFNHKDIAENIVNIIETEETPFNIAIIGKWGIGKSSVIEIVKGKLKNPKKYKFHEINAWKYEKEALRRALTKQLFISLDRNEQTKAVEDLKQKSSIIMQEKEETNSILNQLKNMLEESTRILIKAFFILVFIVIILSILIGIYTIFTKADYVLTWKDVINKLLSITTVISVLLAIFEKYIEINFKEGNSITTINKPIKDVDQYEDLLKEHLKKIKYKEIVIIDDLDRLSPEKIVEALDAIKAFTELKNIIFIVPFDDDILRKALENNKIKLNESYIVEGELFLDKLFQFKIYMPPLPEYDLKQYSDVIVAEEAPGFLEICKNNYKDIMNILIYPGVKTPRQVKKIINTFMNNMLILEKRKDKVIDRLQVDSDECKMIVAKISVLQSDFNEFYKLLIEDFNLIEDFLQIYNNLEKSENIRKNLNVFFDSEGNLKREWLPLANFLSYTSNIKVDNIETYIYLTQSKIGKRIGDKKYTEIKTALKSGNKKYLIEALSNEEEYEKVEIVLGDELSNVNSTAKEVETAFVLLSYMKEESIDSIKKDLINNIDKQWRNKKIVNFSNYDLSNFYIIYDKGNEILNEIIKAKLQDDSDIVKNLVYMLNTDYKWDDVIREKVKEIINKVINNNFDNINMEDIIEDIEDIEKFSFKYYITNENYSKLAEDIYNKGLENYKIVNIIENKSLEMIDLGNISLVINDLKNWINNETLIKSLIKVIEYAISQKNILKIQDGNLLLLNIKENIIEKQKDNIIKIFELLNYDIDDNNKDKFDNLLKILESNTYIPSIVKKLKENNKLQLLPKLTKQISEKLLEDETINNYGYEVIDSYSDEQLKELNAEISQAIVYSSNNASDSEIKNAINIYLRMLEKEKIPIFMENVLKKAVSDFNSYYSSGKSYWNYMIIELIGKGYQILSNSEKITYLNRVKNLIANSTYSKLGIIAIGNVWENLNAVEKSEIVISITNYIDNLKDSYNILETISKDDEVKKENLEALEDKVLSILNENNYNELQNTIFNLKAYLNLEKFIEKITEFKDKFLNGIELIKKMNFSRQTLVKSVFKNIYDVDKLKLTITNLDIKIEEIEEMDLNELESLVIFNILKTVVELEGNYDWIWKNIIYLTHNEFYEIEFYEWLNVLPNKYKINKNYKEQYSKELVDIVNSSASEEVNNQIFKFIKENKMINFLNYEEINEEDREKLKNY